MFSDEAGVVVSVICCDLIEFLVVLVISTVSDLPVVLDWSGIVWALDRSDRSLYFCR